MIEVIQLYLMLGPDSFMREEVQLVNFTISTPKIPPVPKPRTTEEIFDEGQRFNTVIMILVLLVHTSVSCFRTSVAANAAHIEVS